MDLKSVQAELKQLAAKNAAIVTGVKATNRDLTDAEIADLEKDGDRILELKRLEKGLLNADLTGRIGAGSSTEEVFPGGLGTPSHNAGTTGAKGFITAASLKQMAQTNAAKGVKALIQAGSSSTAIPLETSPVLIPQTGLGILGLIPTKVRETPSYKYLRQVSRESNAAVVAPGATKPTSEFTLAEVSGSLAVVAHLSEMVDKYVLADNDDLERFLQGELEYGIVRKVTADAIAAFLATSGIQTHATEAGYTPAKGIDGIYAGASLVQSAGYNPNVLVLNRGTYDELRLSKDAEERYIAGNPFQGGELPGLWGMTTLISPDVDASTALVFDSSRLGLSVDKQGVETLWDSATGFDKNQLRARTEGRFGYDVFSPMAIAKITFTA